MKTMVRIFKDFDKNIVFRDCQMHILTNIFEKKGESFDFLPSFWWTFCQKATVIGLLL